MHSLISMLVHPFQMIINLIMRASVLGIPVATGSCEAASHW